MKRIIILTILSVVILLTTIASWFIATEWQPLDIEEATVTSPQQSTQLTHLPQSIEVVSWNIGYAGLGEQMDFFYDGGKKMRCSEAETRENLKQIIAQLKIFAKSADFILLQEVDEDSHRSYGINMRKAIAKALPEFQHSWAYNYRSQYIPAPINDPMGRVNSGIMTLSRHAITQAIRYQYPNTLTLPKRLFLLKRAMLCTEISTTDGKTLWINNTHNSAFDSGEGRRREITKIREIMEKQPLSITAGDWNSTPPNYTASTAALTNKYFHPIAIEKGDFPRDFSFAADLTKPTMRYLDNVYNPASSTICNIDFGVVNNYLRITNCMVIDLGFKNSDHNPIAFWVNSTDN